MGHSTIRVSPAYTLVPLGAIREGLGFTPKGVRLFLEALGVPILDLSQYRGHEPSDDDCYVNGAVYEMLCLAASLPREPAWEKYRTDPTAMQLLMGVLTAVYGVPEREELHQRLRALGERLVRENMRDARIPGRRAVYRERGHGKPAPTVLKRIPRID